MNMITNMYHIVQFTISGQNIFNTKIAKLAVIITFTLYFTVNSVSRVAYVKEKIFCYS